MTQQTVKAHLADNFNTAAALQSIMNLVHITNIELCKKHVGEEEEKLGKKLVGQTLL